jgi:hypothetical protein
MHRPPGFAVRLVRLALIVAFAGLVAACELMQAPASPIASSRTRSAGPIESAAPEATDEVPTLRPEPSGEFDLIGEPTPSPTSSRTASRS